MSTSFERTLYIEKLQVGPTASRPGPILLKHERTAEKLVVMLKPSSDTIIKLAIIITTYAAR